MMLRVLNNTAVTQWDCMAPFSLQKEKLHLHQQSLFISSLWGAKLVLAPNFSMYLTARPAKNSGINVKLFHIPAWPVTGCLTPLSPAFRGSHQPSGTLTWSFAVLCYGVSLQRHLYFRCCWNDPGLRFLAYRKCWGQWLCISKGEGEGCLVLLYFPRLCLWRERTRQERVAFPCHLSH